jgi:hypothetical protein
MSPGIEFRWQRATFRTLPDKICGPPSRLCNGYLVAFQGTKRPGRVVAHPPLTAPRLKKESKYSSVPLLCVHGVCLWYNLTITIHTVGTVNYNVHGTVQGFSVS